MYLKRLHPRGAHVMEVMEDFEGLKDFSTLSKTERKTYGRNKYKIFDVVLKKLSGSDGNVDTQKQFLNSRFTAMHKQPLIDTSASWKKVKSMLGQLKPMVPKPFSTLSNEQKIYSSRAALRETFQGMVNLLAGSESFEEHAAALTDHLQRENRGFTIFLERKSNADLDVDEKNPVERNQEVIDQSGVIEDESASQVLSLIQQLKKLLPNGEHVNAVIEEMKTLKDFTNLEKKQRKNESRYSRYRPFDNLLKKVSGSNEPATHRKFLCSRFQAIHKQELIEQSWKRVKDMIECLLPNEPTVFSSLSDFDKRKATSKFSEQNVALKTFITGVAGSNQLKEQQSTLGYYFMRWNPRTKEKIWSNFSKTVMTLPTLEPFSGSKEQKSRNKQKYVCAKNLVKKLSGSGKRPAVQTQFLEFL